MGDVEQVDRGLGALPPGTKARPATPDDLDDVARIARADQVADRGEPDITREDLASLWARPKFDPATQSLVVEDDGEVVAYGDAAYRLTRVHVHPDHHGRGIGGALLDWAEDNARARGEPYVGQTVYDGNAAALALHRERGYRVRWETWLLSIDHPAPLEPPTPPPGITLREVDREADARAVYEVIDAAFATWTERDPYDFADWRSTYWDAPEFDPRWCHVAQDADGRILGACLGLVEDLGEGVLDGVVDQLGVLPSEHGRGIGGLLLRNAFATFAAEGVGRTVLSTESRGTARGFYEHNGMSLLRSFTRFVKDL